jgi:hypothetical protein
VGWFSTKQTSSHKNVTCSYHDIRDSKRNFARWNKTALRPWVQVETPLPNLGFELKITKEN